MEFLNVTSHLAYQFCVTNCARIVQNMSLIGNFVNARETMGNPLLPPSD